MEKILLKLMKMNTVLHKNRMTSGNSHKNQKKMWPLVEMVYKWDSFSVFVCIGIQSCL